ncbi:unnamed protein product, partial [Gulo gulo]
TTPRTARRAPRAPSRPFPPALRRRSVPLPPLAPSLSPSLWPGGAVRSGREFAVAPSAPPGGLTWTPTPRPTPRPPPKLFSDSPATGGASAAPAPGGRSLASSRPREGKGGGGGRSGAGRPEVRARPAPLGIWRPVATGPAAAAPQTSWRSGRRSARRCAPSRTPRARLLRAGAAVTRPGSPRPGLRAPRPQPPPTSSTTTSRAARPHLPPPALGA